MSNTTEKTYEQLRAEIMAEVTEPVSKQQRDTVYDKLNKSNQEVVKAIPETKIVDMAIKPEKPLVSQKAINEGRASLGKYTPDDETLGKQATNAVANMWNGLFKPKKKLSENFKPVTEAKKEATAKPETAPVVDPLPPTEKTVQPKATKTASSKPEVQEKTIPKTKGNPQKKVKSDVAKSPRESNGLSDSAIWIMIGTAFNLILLVAMFMYMSTTNSNLKIQIQNVQQEMLDLKKQRDAAVSSLTEAQIRNGELVQQTDKLQSEVTKLERNKDRLEIQLGNANKALSHAKVLNRQKASRINNLMIDNQTLAAKVQEYEQFAVAGDMSGAEWMSLYNEMQDNYEKEKLRTRELEQLITDLQIEKDLRNLGYDSIPSN